MTTLRPPSHPGCVWIEPCIEMCTGRSVCVDENGVQAWFRNSDQTQIRKVHYDGCYDTTEGAYKADFILGQPEVIDVVIELKRSHGNLKQAFNQIVSTLEGWADSPIRYRKLAALIIYGEIWTRDNLPRRRPKALSSVQTVLADFRKEFEGKVRLLIYESGEKQFTFNDFLRNEDAR